MKARRRTNRFRLALEIFLVVAFILALSVGALLAQARSGWSTFDAAPVGEVPAEIEATPIPSVQAALMSAEMAALTPPFFMVDLPLVQR
jgi:hypothetical protein